MENKNLKKSFVLLSTILLVVVFSLLSLRVVETDLLSSNLNTLKYLHFEAIKHRDTLVTYIENHTDEQIKEYARDLTLGDPRFKGSILQEDETSSIYYLSIETVGNSDIRLSQKIIK